MRRSTLPDPLASVLLPVFRQLLALTGTGEPGGSDE